ncbi:unnamed protein product [Allacma fusca]|uniref:Uncharacterized protein n=1 Tax=Allacma fusca TaxID=39272 RepID=A0A8J2KK34_9HEXA|nr:unnamed protein product [Allacma fusca]
MMKLQYTYFTRSRHHCGFRSFHTSDLLWKKKHWGFQWRLNTDISLKPSAREADGMDDTDRMEILCGNRRPNPP